MGGTVGAVSPSDVVIMEDGGDSMTGGGGVGSTAVYYTMLKKLTKTHRYQQGLMRRLRLKELVL